jgi:hypothetical protein
MKKILFASLLLLISSSGFAQATNKDGSIVSGVLTASFDPFASFSAEPIAPFPASLFFQTSTDLTIDLPVPDSTDFTNPRVALNSMDGFSTTEPWITSFAMGDAAQFNNAVPGSIDPNSVIPGQSVRVFKVTTSQFLFVTGIEKELVPGVDFHALASGDRVVILPLQPLEQYSDYMAVLTNDIRDTRGNDATPDRTYYFGQQPNPWVDANGKSTNLLFSDAAAAQLELVRQIVGSMEAAAAAAGVVKDDIVLSWTVHTQSTAPVLGALRAIAQPGPTQIAPTGLTTQAVGGFGLADIYMGVITMPYYGGIPSAQNPAAHLSDFWKAVPGAYLPPFDQLPLDPTSTNLTIANRFPVLTGMQTVPILVTVPNALSGASKPADGWPVVLFMHGLLRNRTDALAIADAMAQAGHVVISMDGALHGVVPDVEPRLAPFWIENTPFAPIANERTFDADVWNNTTGAPGPDGVMDASGFSAVNLANLQALRDNFRQTIADMSVLAVSVGSMSIDGDANGDFRGTNIGVVAQSGLGFFALPFASLEPLVNRVYLNVTGGGTMRTLNGGAYGTAFIQPFLSALAGIEPGTPRFEQYMIVAQSLMDQNDNLNWVAAVNARGIPIIHNQVIGDAVVPNDVPGAPLAGSNPLNRLLGLQGYQTTQQNMAGLRGVAKFLPPAEHSSLLLPTQRQVTTEMQGQMATFIATGGTTVVVGDSSLLEPVAVPAAKAPEGKEKGQQKRDLPRIKPEKRILD